MTTPFDTQQFVLAAKGMRSIAAPDDASVRTLRARSQEMKKVLSEIAHVRDYLVNLERKLDSVLMPAYVFDLTSPTTVGEVIVYKLLQQPKVRLTELQGFYGSGVYIIYYRGAFSAYEAIAGTDVPIYVGVKGPKIKNADSPKRQGTALFERISEHLTRSIARATSTLAADDFCCRYLVVQSGLEPAAEEFLKRLYLPVWNTEAGVCSGLGKHGDQPTARAGGPAGREEKSDWDILHPGRPWAVNQTSRSGATPATITARIDAHFLNLLRHDKAKWSSLFNPVWIARQPA
jgi:hypothetical protein